RHTSPQRRQSGRRTAWPVACAATISCWRPASNSFPSARVNPKLAISPRSSGRLIFKTSAHCLSPSAPVFTNLTIQATRLPPIRDQTPNYRLGARTPNLQAVPRGSLQAYDINTGKQVWRTYTVPLKNEPGGDSWRGDSAEHGGGVGWLVGSYDPKTNTVFWGTSNPAPWNTAIRSSGNGDYGKLTNLYTASTLALDADTGKIKWWVQGTPADAWDYDGVNELVLADLKMDGETAPVMMKADRNGFFFVVNRETGKVLSAEKYVPTTWAEKWDIATSRAVEDPDKRAGMPNHPAKGVCPNLIGGKNWQPMSYNPETGLVYIPSNNVCMDWSVSDVTYKRGVFYLGGEFPPHDGPGGNDGELIAWDPVKHEKVWGLKSDLPFNGGTLTTGGDLVFQGDLHGDFRALDAKTGEELWKKNLGSGMGAGPITYKVNGKQYVAVVVGRTVSLAAFLGDIGNKMLAATPEGGALFVFTVD